jgi:4-hydroxy-3-polyprenylbenzoate decarboxylase
MKRIVIAITGATGAIYGIRLLEILKEIGVESHLIISKAAKLTIAHETKYSFDEVVALASHYYNNNEIAASIASGSFKTEGMIVAPCTVKSLGEIAGCLAQNLVSRAADVTLKERRKLVLLFRESPLHLGHIKSMYAVTEMGGIICPPSVLFYNKPESIQQIIDQHLGRVLDLFNLETNVLKRWEGI